MRESNKTASGLHCICVQTRWQCWRRWYTGVRSASMYRSARWIIWCLQHRNTNATSDTKSNSTALLILTNVLHMALH